MISSYGDQSTTEIILHIIIVLHQRCLNCSECFQRHLMFYTCNYNIRVTHRNGAIKHIFYTNQIHGGIISRLISLFILSLHALALHLAVKILLNLSVWRFEHVIYIHLSGLYFPPECQQDHNCSQPILLSENIPNIDINHQQNTRRSDQIETIKTIMQTTRPRITWKVLPMAQGCIFKKIFESSAKRFRL